MLWIALDALDFAMLFLFDQHPTSHVTYIEFGNKICYRARHMPTSSSTTIIITTTNTARLADPPVTTFSLISLSPLA